MATLFLADYKMPRRTDPKKEATSHALSITDKVTSLYVKNINAYKGKPKVAITPESPNQGPDQMSEVHTKSEPKHGPFRSGPSPCFLGGPWFGCLIRGPSLNTRSHLSKRSGANLFGPIVRFQTDQMCRCEHTLRSLIGLIW